MTKLGVESGSIATTASCFGTCCSIYSSLHNKVQQRTSSVLTQLPKPISSTLCPNFLLTSAFKSCKSLPDTMTALWPQGCFGSFSSLVHILRISTPESSAFRQYKDGRVIAPSRAKLLKNILINAVSSSKGLTVTNEEGWAATVKKQWFTHILLSLSEPPQFNWHQL